MSSLTTAPKINWDSVDGVVNTDMNEIGVNLNSLDDGKYEEDDSPIFSGVQTDNALIKQKVISAAVSGTASITIAHGLTATNIRGLSPSVDHGVQSINAFGVNGANVEVFFTGAITATCYCVVSYV